jgi:hypothetical protein
MLWIVESPARRPQRAAMAAIAGRRRAAGRAHEVTVKGSDIQEDSPDEISRAIAEWHQSLA